MKGRKPQPTAIKRLRGVRTPRINAHEPHPPRLEAAVDVPAALRPFPAAVEEWTYLVPMLRRCKQITSADRASLLALCLEWAKYLDAQAHIATGGLLVKGKTGRLWPNPYLAVANRALMNCMRLWPELGLTPSGRSRVKVAEGSGPGVDGDTFTEFDVVAGSAIDVHPH